MKFALITGITGQDGSYLAELLLEKKYSVHGLVRRSSNNTNLCRIQHLLDNPNLRLHDGDLLDASSLQTVLNTVWRLVGSHDRFEIYNLAAQTHVQYSFAVPEHTLLANGPPIVSILEWIRAKYAHERALIRFYQASTSELYGKVVETPQKETTPFYPRSPYGVAKLYAFWIVKNYREAYGLFATNGILFNHESPRRGDDFVTKKITNAVKRIHTEEVWGLKTPMPLEIGNLDAKRDWGHARDYVEGMWRILQSPVADDWVLSSNETHSVREFVERAFAEVGRRVVWQGEGVTEKGLDVETGQVLVTVNPAFFRPTEVDLLWGDSTRARRELGWAPTFTFEGLVKDMMGSSGRATASQTLNTKN